MSDVTQPDLIWTAVAQKDVAEIFAYIAQHSEFYAGQMVDKIKRRANELILQPKSGREVPLINDTSIREVYVHPYRIVYTADEAAVYIIRVSHHARLLKL